MSYNLKNSKSWPVDEKQRDSFSVPQITIIQANGKSPEKQNISERGTYTHSIHSLLLCISMSVGLGNIWRFPSEAYKNGGAAFLIPYLILLFIIGRPLYYMELILGQFSSQGPIKVWSCVPAFRGIGYAQVISVSIVVIFYNYLMALSVYYMFASMQTCLPWTECFHSNESFSENGTLLNGKTPPEHFWLYEVLEENNNPNEIMSISWKLVLCLLLTWCLVYISVVKGVASLGKMSYVTAFSPYVVLITLLIISCLEEGAIEGLKFFFIPDFKKLLEINVWYKACEQSFFSLAIGYGNIVMISSYNKFRNNIYRDAILISILDTITNILAGAVIFAVLGSLSVKYDKPVDLVVNHDDMGLAFIAYPEALARIKYVPQLWSTLFFFMLFVLGMGSSMSMIETVLTVVKDQFTKLRSKEWLLSLCVCIIFFSLGIPLTTNAGQRILVVLNNYGVGAAVFLYAILESVGIMWIYGLKNFCRDVTFMLNRPVGIFWKVTWGFTAPVALMIIFVYGSAKPNSMPDSDLPLWATVSGWVLAAVALIQIPIWFGRALYNDSHTTLLEKLRSVMKPTSNWGPSDPPIRALWRSLKENKKEKNQVNIASTISAAYENQSYKEDVF